MTLRSLLSLDRYHPMFDTAGGAAGGQGGGQTGGQSAGQAGQQSGQQAGTRVENAGGQTSGQQAGQQAGQQTGQQGTQQTGQTGQQSSGTIADGNVAAGQQQQQQQAVGKWPDNWRELIAGDDKTFLEQLKRFDAPSAVGRSWRELSGKISSGELKAPAKPLAEGATAEQVTAWRKENGLPESAEALISGLKLPDGLVPGEGDKPMLNAFAKAMFADGKGTANQEFFNQATSWYFKTQAEMDAQRTNADALFKGESITALKSEWGSEFTANNNAVTNLLSTFPAELRSSLLLARLPNGNIVGNDPDFNRAMLLMAKQINPAASLLPATAGSSLASVEDRIAHHEKNMRAEQGSDGWRAYWQSSTAQAELRTLYEARETMKKRSAA